MFLRSTLFLGPRGPHGLPSLVSPSVRPQEKIGSHIYRLICLMNHLKTHKTSLMAPWDPLNAPLDPLGTPGPAPPSIPNDPKTGLLNHSPAFQITRRPIKCHCWSYGTSYPSPLNPSDPIGLPLNRHRLDLPNLSSPVWYWSNIFRSVTAKIPFFGRLSLSDAMFTNY